MAKGFNVRQQITTDRPMPGTYKGTWLPGDVVYFEDDKGQKWQCQTEEWNQQACNVLVKIDSRSGVTVEKG